MDENSKEKVERAKQVFRSALQFPPGFAVLVGEYVFQLDLSPEVRAAVMNSEAFEAYATEYEEAIAHLPEKEDVLREPLEELAEGYRKAVDLDEE